MQAKMTVKNPDSVVLTIKLSMTVKEWSELSEQLHDALEKEAGIQSVYIMRTSLPAKIPQILTVKVEMETE